MAALNAMVTATLVAHCSILLLLVVTGIVCILVLSCDLARLLIYSIDHRLLMRHISQIAS